MELVLYGHHGYSDMDNEGGEMKSTSRQGAGSLTQREALSLALLLQRSSALDPLLLVLELHSLAVELLLHLLVSSVELLLGLLQLALLLGNLLLEHHLHLGLHLGEFLLV